MVAGPLVFINPHTGVEVDCSSASHGILLESYWLTKPVTIRAAVNFVLVVEKETIFQRLLDERFFDRLACILITGR